MKIRLAAPPVDGEANQELIKFLAKSLSARKSDVTLIHGHKSRLKTVEILVDSSMDAAAVVDTLKKLV